MKKKIISLLFLIVIFSIEEIGAAVITATSTGNWGTASTWDLNRIPQCGDTIVVPVTLTVTVAAMQDYTSCSEAMRVEISGTLTFQSGKKLSLPCNSQVIVNSGGEITAEGGGGNSNYIEICNQVVWSSADGTATGPTSFNQAQPLPVQLLYFKAQQLNRGIVLTWETASELNSSFFSIERSVDGFLFTELYRIKAAGQSLQKRLYSVTDHHPQKGISYYRLKEVDLDNATTIYDVIAIEFQCDELKFYPNPSNGDFVIESNWKNEVPAEIYNSNGKCIFKCREGENNMHGLLQPGIYYVKISGNNEMQKLVIY